ncbi:MAG: hypothetical protein PHH58_05265 [Rhodoferax sp.]|nr:hypothetical protein [Rhodoferax sp.]
MATKQITPGATVADSAAAGAAPSEATAPTPELSAPGAGGMYAFDPATSVMTLVVPAATHGTTRKVQDPATGVITRVAVKE